MVTGYEKRIDFTLQLKNIFANSRIEESWMGLEMASKKLISAVKQPAGFFKVWFVFITEKKKVASVCLKGKSGHQIKEPGLTAAQFQG